MFVKFCEPQFNPLEGCKTIRLGTIEYYRTLDPSFTIADSDEGIDTYSVNYFSGAPNKECESFLGNSFFQLGEAKRVTIHNVKVERKYPNCYIWCCKKIDGQVKPEDGLAIDPKYTSNYKIEDPKDFAEYITQRLFSKLSIENFDETSQKHILENSLEFNELKVGIYFNEIQYVDQKKGAFNMGNSFHYNYDFPDSFRQVFTKPKKYEPDSEFRFLFQIVCPRTQKTLAVKKEPIDLNCLPMNALD